LIYSGLPHSDDISISSSLRFGCGRDASLNLPRRRADQKSMANGESIESTTRRAVGAFAVGTSEHFRWLLGIVKAVLVLNLIDAVFTLYWVRGGLATEANTLIDELVNENALGFIAIKLSLVAMGSWLLWQKRRHPAAVVGIFTVFLAYYGILLFHLQYASALLRHLHEIG
jgi:hypothetical protein